MSSEIERLQRAAAQDPAQLIRLADTLVAAGRAEEAVQACRRGLGARPDDVALRLALGRALSAAGHLEEAQAALLDAVARQQRPSARAAAPEPRSRAADRPPSFADEIESDPGASWPAEPVPASPQRRAPAASTAVEVRPHRGQDADPTVETWPQPSPAENWNEPSNETWHEAPPAESWSPAEPQGPVDLDRVAERLLGEHVPEGWKVERPVADPVPDEMRRGFEARRARSFVLLWVALVVATGAIIGGVIYRARKRAEQIAISVAGADARVLEATYEGDAAARDAFAAVLRLDPHSRKFAAMAALANARLAADQGEDSDAAGWAMLRRSEKEAARHAPEVDERADRELRQARAWLALARGEACPPVDDAVDGALAARCALQRGDHATARRILAAGTASPDHPDLRSLLLLGSLELGAGDLDAADAAFGRVLAVSAAHPRALVGRALVALERGESPTVTPPVGRLGPTTDAWFHLAAGLGALGRDDQKATAELDLAFKGIVHSGRLALLYGRARLQQGRIADAEQAMRIAERLDPNDVDVAVLDAEVALAKGFEDKVASALSSGTPTPRRLAVLGRALVLTGHYKEGASALDAALARRPGDTVALTYRAVARAHLGDQAGAQRELEKAASSQALTTPHYGLGLLAYERHDLARAQKELGKSVERNPESFRARALLGRVLREQGKLKEALDELLRVAREAPALVPVHETLGKLYLDLARDREARGEFRKVLDNGKASLDDKLGFAEAVVHLGIVDEAERALEDAVGAPAPRLARLKLELQSWKGPKEALAAAKALEAQRKGPAAHDARLAIAAADAWRRGGDLKRAADDLRAALAADPLHGNLGLGRVLLLQNDNAGAELSFKSALQAWEKAAGGVDDQTEARVGQARAELLRKAAADAVATLTPCLTDDPTAPEPHYWLARAQVDRGEAEQARSQAEKASELDDHYADAFFLVGELNRAAHKDKARFAYKRYLELSPNGDQSKAAKAALKVLK